MTGNNKDATGSSSKNQALMKVMQQKMESMEEEPEEVRGRHHKKSKTKAARAHRRGR